MLYVFQAHKSVKKLNFTISMKNYIHILFLIGFGLLHGQKDSVKKVRKVIQLSGVLVTGDSLQALPYANVVIKNNKKGTITDYSGFFSIVAKSSDTLVFSSIGYETSMYVLPDSLIADQYSLVHIMKVDTILLSEVEIKPWPTYEQFKNIFMDIEVPTTDMDRAKENLDQIAQADLGNIEISDPGLAFKAQMAERNSRLYYIGQIPPNNLLNPLAWAEFIKSWKNGDFKND